MRTLVVYPRKVVMVFDSTLWDKNGGDSRTDTFFRKATILEVQHSATGNPKSETATVEFHHDGRISFGHFTNMMEEI